jgi:hypothetical protein
VRESLHLDVATFGRVVSFIEGEGCSLTEGLRRAVRIGVEVLLMDKTVSEDRPAHSYIPETHAPSHRIGTPSVGYQPVSDYAEPENDASTDYAHTAPLGLF